LQQLGFESRLPWLIENTLEALALLRDETPRKLIPAIAALQLFANLHRHAPRESPSLDILDPAIRSEKTVEATRRKGSDISRRLGIVSVLTPEDFVDPLKVALESD
jgi:hypothetical protein